MKCLCAEAFMSTNAGRRGVQVTWTTEAYNGVYYGVGSRSSCGECSCQDFYILCFLFSF